MTNGPLSSVGGTPDYTGAYTTIREGRSEDLLGVAWRSFALASLDTTERLLRIYMDFIYPVFPLFHGPTLWQRFRNHEHLSDRGFFASVMAACALASARARDGAYDGIYAYAIGGAERQSEIFFAAAQDAIVKDFSAAIGPGYLRACGLLAFTALQYGQIKTMHEYLGHYLTLCAMCNFHDESRWPADVGIVEKEERRRLFWTMYGFDIFTSVTFDSIMRSQETHASVSYPSEISDEDLTTGIPSPSNEDNWLRGWNFTTDLYRVLEHTVKRIRRHKLRREDRTSVVKLLMAEDISEMKVLESVLNLYYQLPAHFRDYSVPMTGEKGKDIFGFQTANIQATLQLVRIAVCSTDGNSTEDVRRKCDVAEQVLSTFRTVSPHFLKAISTPLVYHLGAIGTILASAMEGMLTEESYARVRSLLVSMADLLQDLESSLQPTAGASKIVREQIAKVDQYMQTQRQMIASWPQQDTSMSGHANAAMTSTTGMLSTAGQSQRPTGLTPMEEFQLPPDLVGEWPWPFEFTQNDYPNQMYAIQGYN